MKLSPLQPITFNKIICTCFAFFLTLTAFSQKIVESNGVSVTNIDVTSPQVVSQITINPVTSGKVVVRFNGLAVTSPGDRIILAASDSPDWSVSSGAVSAESISADLNYNSFSHSRVYDVTPGSYTYYAVMHRWVEHSGTGLASAYGNFTVEFFPDSSTLESTIIEQINQNLSSPLTLGQVSLNAPSAGKVIVHFDGYCVSSEGDRILLAASNSSNWGVNDGHVAVEAYDSDINRHSFSHTRVYNVGPGAHNFYAVGQNFVETDGSGVASVYGNLTAEFVPTNVPDEVLHEGIVDVNQNFNSLSTIESIGINPSQDGKIIVQFNGMCVSDPGDLIVLAASNTPNWSVNDGNTGVEAIDDDLNTRVFIHTRVYDVSAGFQTFNAVGQNFVETAGDGFASIYGSLLVKFISNSSMQSCEEPLWYIPEVGSGLPALQLCEPMEGYCLAHQECAEFVTSQDAYCINNNWDFICQNAYANCVSEEGCTYPDACNYNSLIFNDDGSCEFPDCTDEFASNYNALALCGDLSLCEYECDGDFNDDGLVSVADLSAFLSNFGNSCFD